MPKQLLSARLAEFFKNRFSLQDNALWRVVTLLRPHRKTLLAANICLIISQMMTAVGLVALYPLFDYAINRTVDKPAAAQVQTAEVDAQPATTEAQDKETRKEARREKKAQKEMNQVEKQVERRKQDLQRLLQFQWVTNLIDQAKAQWEAANQWAKASPSRYISCYAVFILVLFLFKGMAEFLGNFLMGKVGVDVSSGLMNAVYANVLRQELEFFDHNSTGSLLNICYREVYNIQSLVTTLASRRVILPFTMVSLFFALMFISFPLSMLLLVMLPLVILPTMWVTRRLRTSLASELGGESEIMDTMAQGIMGIMAIKTFGAEELERQQLEPVVGSYVSSTRSRRAAQAIVGPMVDVLNMIVLMIVFVLAIYLFAGKIDLTGGKLAVFMMAITRFYKPMREIMKMNVTMQRARAMARRVFSLLDRVPQIQDVPDAVDFPAHWDRIALEDTRLEYTVRRRNHPPRRHLALKDANLEILRGESVAIIGPNGAGKSSIVKLLCRLYEPSSGQILIGQTPLSQIKMQQIRENICLITQHPVLFDRSVSENIAFSTQGATQEEIEAAARATGADAFIRKLQHGYQTSVGEGGRLLSGGERQKIVLARAFMRRPHILILDEPTTGLDNQTVAEFLDLVEQLHAKGMTILYITHEHTHLDRFDRVLEFSADHTVHLRPAVQAPQGA